METTVTINKLLCILELGLYEYVMNVTIAYYLCINYTDCDL